MPKSRELGTAVCGGLLAGGFLTAILSITDLPLGSTIGALIGGGVAAYVLYGKVHSGALVGVLSAIGGYPFYIGVVYILLIFGVYTPPAGPTPSMSVIQEEVVLEFLLNLVSGGLGGIIVASARRPPPPVAAPAQPPTGYAPSQARYCVQCGARLQAGTLICPHCNARQPAEVVQSSAQ
jgi:hypothetical protein